MNELLPGQEVNVKGSAKEPYTLRNDGGVFYCSCPAWRVFGGPIDHRICKHLRAHLGSDHPYVLSFESATKTTPTPKTPATPPLLLLAHTLKDEDVTGWWMSEKLDGIRAFWDGTRLISRLGNVIHAPDWFLAELPKVALDGELWIERGAFQQTTSIVRRQDKGDGWRKVKYVVFDAPLAGGTFEERLAYLEKHAPTTTVMFVLPQRECVGLGHFKAEMRSVSSLGGEGLMLRKPGSHYESGRSTTLLKAKTFLDAEAEVIGHEPGKGRHVGRLGALACKLPSGVTFNVGTGFSDKERASPPAIGTTITFRYQELSTTGTPRFPSFLRVAVDL